MEDHPKVTPRVTSNDLPPGHLDASHNERDQGNWQTSSLPGTSKAILLSSSHFKILICNCQAKTGSGVLGHRCRKASGKRRYLSGARTKEPNERNASRRKLTTPTMAPPNPTLITLPGSGPRTTSPTGADIQGPSSMDYNLELEVEFPTDMVIEM